MAQAHVSVDLFSGRENPSWALPAEEARRVREALQTLPAGTRPLPDVGLGYRGFTVVWEDGARATVYRNVVEYTARGQTVLLEDSERGLEKRLLAGAKGHLAPELYAAVDSQVQSP
jgi:hypothetical protein